MKSRGYGVVTAVIAIAIGLFTTPVKAHADTYQFFDLSPDTTAAGTTSVYGITDSGAVVLVETLHVGVPQCANQGICTEYETFVDGTMVSESPTAPSLVYDDGTACTPTTSFAATAVGTGVCNNGHEVYVATPSGGQPTAFDGPDLTDVFATSPAFISEVDLNSSGDFAYDISHPAASTGELFEAVDLSSTPEPGSIFLLGTGLFAAGTLRRRLFRS